MITHDNPWQQFDDAFYRDGYNLCNSYLGVSFSIEQLFAAQKQLYKVIDQFISLFIDKTNKEGNSPECRKGCSHCCHQTVLASTWEVLYLTDFIKKKYTGNLINKPIQKLEEKAAITSAMKLDDLLRFKMPCPFLHSIGGFCTVYQARPMACRIYLSSSEKSCANDLESPNDDSIFPDLYEMPLRAGRLLNEGFIARLKEQKVEGLQTFETTIDQGVLVALNNNATQNWLAGKKVFKLLD